MKNKTLVKLISSTILSTLLSLSVVGCVPGPEPQRGYHPPRHYQTHPRIYNPPPSFHPHRNILPPSYHQQRLPPPRYHPQGRNQHPRIHHR